MTQNKCRKIFPTAAGWTVKIGIYLVDGEYYALEDICPHAYALLSRGFVEDGKVECPLHEAVFDLKPASACTAPADAISSAIRYVSKAIRFKSLLSRRAWHERIHGIQSGAAGKPSVHTAKRGRQRHHPQAGDYQNLIWQTRSRAPESWELSLIAQLETLFEQGVETLPALVERLNAVKMHDHQGEARSEASFRAFCR